MKLTPNFKWSEFVNDGVEFGSPLLPYTEVLSSVTKLAWILETIRSRYNKPVIITSGFRTNEENITAGGSIGSYHKLGMAVDFYVKDRSPIVVAKDFQFEQNWPGGFHVYPEKGFIHLDIGEKRRW
jgi:zinc D-Ala-D-Ala carboxypeptidase